MFESREHAASYVFDLCLGDPDNEHVQELRSMLGESYGKPFGEQCNSTCWSKNKTNKNCSRSVPSDELFCFQHTSGVIPPRETWRRYAAVEKNRKV